MNYNIFTTISLVLSFLLFSIFIYGALKSNYKKHRDEDFKKPVISPFQIFVIGVFLALLVNFFIIFYASYSANVPIVTILKGLCSDVFYSIKIFVLGSDLTLIDSFISNNLTNKSLSIIYNLYSMII